MLGEAVMGLGALKTAFDMAKGLKSIDDAVRRNAAVIELQENILAAQEAQAALVKKVGELEAEVARLKTWEAEKQRYKLTQLRPGVLTYTVKEGMENGEPAHHLCASCFNAGHKSFLTEETWFPNRCHVLVCQDCGAFQYQTGNADPAHEKLKRKPYRGS